MPGKIFLTGLDRKIAAAHAEVEDVEFEAYAAGDGFDAAGVAAARRRVEALEDRRRGIDRTE